MMMLMLRESERETREGADDDIDAERDRKLMMMLMLRERERETERDRERERERVPKTPKPLFKVTLIICEINNTVSVSKFIFYFQICEQVTFVWVFYLFSKEWLY